MSTLAYYQQYAAQYAQNTLTVDMTPVYAPFCARLPAGAHIVDAGCGSGRDSKYFKNQGYTVTAFDGCAELAAFAAEQLQQPVQHCQFADFQAPSASVHGIWACASLLHLPWHELPRVLQQFSTLLSQHGVLYASFKYGDLQRQDELGREFTDLNEARLAQLMAHLPQLSVQQQWQSQDRRANQPGQLWLNILLHKR